MLEEGREIRDHVLRDGLSKRNCSPKTTIHSLLSYMPTKGYYCVSSRRDSALVWAGGGPRNLRSRVRGWAIKAQLQPEDNDTQSAFIHAD
ncbi:hypothetical protein PoB_006014700 [Plakobranchus ocellatus]|uniref:Uncharacterized protein n=1 Tax=Plakobranchus ocellatus TaxID=259542 RepID=A0AAV4CP56_9GAST|nr:hypothetical protein PoB_006014700 [Plakobranchus ocellatus]